MAITGELNEIQKVRRVIQFEWQIKDISILEDAMQNEDARHVSPEFSFYGVSWQIQMTTKIYSHAEGMRRLNTWMSLYLFPKSVINRVRMNLSFSVKTVDGKKDSEQTKTCHFNHQRYGSGFDDFVLWSSLMERKSDLLPSGILTVICILNNSETDMANENELLDSSAQTEGGIGVWKLQQHLREISLNGDISDVVLKVEGQEFKSHRCILAARSPVFSAMMKNKMKETVTGIIDIPDVDPNTFSDFLSYLYTGSAEDITSENVAKLYTVADKYQVEVLKEYCLDHMLVNVSIENFCDIFITSIQHDEEKLKETCIQYFAKHSLDIIKTCKWQRFLCENPILSNELFIKHIELNKDIYSVHCNTCHK